MNQLVLSIFPGIDLLGRAFEEEGFCIVRGPDVLWGGDIRTFHPPAGVFDGVIGGPPCQAFTPMASINRKLGRAPKYGNLIPEFERVVGEAVPGWFLMENVARAPQPTVNGYAVRTFCLNNRWLGGVQNRERRFSFGIHESKASRGAWLDLSEDIVLFEQGQYEPAVISTRGWLGQNGSGPKTPEATNRDKAARRRSTSQMLMLQGLPTETLDNAPFTAAGKRLVIANGVPLPMGRAIAKAVKRAMYS